MRRCARVWTWPSCHISQSHLKPPALDALHIGDRFTAVMAGNLGQARNNLGIEQLAATRLLGAQNVPEPGVVTGQRQQVPVIGRAGRRPTSFQPGHVIGPGVNGVGCITGRNAVQTHLTGDIPPRPRHKLRNALRAHRADRIRVQQALLIQLRFPPVPMRASGPPALDRSLNRVVIPVRKPAGDGIKGRGLRRGMRKR